MRRNLALVLSAVVLVAGVGSAVIVAHAASTSSAYEGRHGHGAGQFVGYWMGIDPLDGGDSRRGITRNDDCTLSMIGRDTVFTLCDGTDRAIIRVDDLTRVGSALVSDNLVITCTNPRSTVTLKVRYDVIGRHIVRETVTTQGGEPVDEIVFHRVSER
jgi:hypothetical protein